MNNRNYLNFTNSKQLKKAFKLSKEELNKLIENEEDKQNNINEFSSWKATKSQTHYLILLKELSKIKYNKLRKIKILMFKNFIKKISNKKIKVLLVCHEFQTFPSFMSVYNKMKNEYSKYFDCELVYVPFYHQNKSFNQIDIKEYYKNDYKEVISHDKYKLNISSPDVCIYLKPYDIIPKQFYINEIKQHINTIIYIPYGMEIGSAEESIRYQFQLDLHDCANACISYCKWHYERACLYSKQKGKNYLPIGHPRMDLINLDLTENKDYTKIKKLAKNRYIFMFNSHFTISNDDNWGTFLIYGIDILKYFSKHKELFLIYRPHPFLDDNINKIWKDNKDKLNEYKKLLNDNKDNIYYDTSSNYLVAMHLCNALISDANSFVPEILCYNKPVIYTKKHDTTGFDNKELEKLLYICDNSKQIFNYVEKLSKGIDPYKEEREYNVSKVLYFNKNENVADKIIKYLIKNVGE